MNEKLLELLGIKLNIRLSDEDNKKLDELINSLINTQELLKMCKVTLDEIENSEDFDEAAAEGYYYYLSEVALWEGAVEVEKDSIYEFLKEITGIDYRTQL